jgi:sulfoxide reductase heme-binding subunit YedZ
MLATALGQHFFWITSRAAGTAALLLSSISVCVGLTMGGKMLKGRGPDLRVTHEALSLATIVALVVHGVSLLGDKFMHPSVADISVPFVSSYKEPWMAIGIIGGWLLIILGLTYYARARIGVARWRKLHRFTALAWILGLVHSIGEGTDAGKAWFLISAGIVVLPAVALLVTRMTGPPSDTGGVVKSGPLVPTS